MLGMPYTYDTLYVEGLFYGAIYNFKKVMLFCNSANNSANNLRATKNTKKKD